MTTDTTTAAPANLLGTSGRASVSGLVIEWDSSQEARKHPETFIAWLHTQAAGHRQAGALIPELVKRFHGKGPAGHAGVPEEFLNEFIAKFAEAEGIIAGAFDRLAMKYGGHVEQAEHELTQRYGREVLASAVQAHNG